MHMDGSAFAQVFFRGFLLEFEDALEDADLSKLPEIDLYVIRNGRLDDFDTRRNTSARTVSIATRTIESLFKITLDSSLFRIYVLAERYGMKFRLTAIPEDCPIRLAPFDFDVALMHELFDLGFQVSKEGDPWMTFPPDLDPDELGRAEPLRR